MGSAAAQGSVDDFQDTAEIVIDIAVPKTKNAKAVGNESGIAPHVAPLMVIMIVLTAIHLDDQMMPHANEVNDDLLARRLTAEMIPASAP